MSQETAQMAHYAQKYYGPTAAQRAQMRDLGGVFGASGRFYRYANRYIVDRHYNGAASVETLCRRILYGGRKGRSAQRKLKLAAKDSRMLMHLEELNLDIKYLAFVTPPRSGKKNFIQTLKVTMEWAEIDG